MGVAGTVKASNGYRTVGRSQEALCRQRSVPFKNPEPCQLSSLPTSLLSPSLPTHTEDHLIRSAHLFPKAGEGVALILIFFAVRVLRNKITNKYS